MAKQSMHIKIEWLNHLIITCPQRMPPLVQWSSLIFPQMITLMVLLKQKLSSVTPPLPQRASSGNLLEFMQILEPQLRPSESGTLVVELTNLSFNEPRWRLRTTVIKKSWTPPTQFAAYAPFLPYLLLFGLIFGPSLLSHPYPNVFVELLLPFGFVDSLSTVGSTLDTFQGLWFRVSPVFLSSFGCPEKDSPFYLYFFGFQHQNPLSWLEPWPNLPQ